MPASIVADHDVPAKVCAYLRTYGHRVLEHNQLRREGDRTVGLDDDDILFCAANGGDAVLTRNYRDFRTLHDRGRATLASSNARITAMPASLRMRYTPRFSVCWQLTRIWSGSVFL